MNKNQLLIRLLALAFIPVLLSSCDLSRKYEKEEKEDIAAYLARHIETMYVKMPSGLYYYEETTGTGAGLETGDSAYFKYSAAYLNDEVFASIMASNDTAVSAIGVGDLIEGFDEGISYMKVGGISRLVIPSFLGYGSSGIYFPAYTPIVYEIKLLDVMDMTPDK